MRIISLKLENFQGVADKFFDFEDGQNYSIYGDNATGKTTVYNAFTWLLTGNSSTGIKSFNPKTIEAHGLDHSVEAVMLDEKTQSRVTLKRVFREVYTKKRGAVSEVFSGHTTDYYIDDVPQKEKDFSAKITELFGEPDEVKALTMPFYFPEVMKWDERRKILIDICGDVFDEDVFNSNPELKGLTSVLDGHSVEELRTILAARKTKLNKEMDSVPIRIDEANKSIPAELEDEANIRASIEDFRKSLEELKSKRLELEKGSVNVNEELKLKIVEKQSEIEKAKAQYLNTQNEKLTNYQHELGMIQNNIRETESRKWNYENKARQIAQDIEQMTKRREELAEQFKLTSERTWDDTKEICPTCGQPLPAEQITELKEKFNLDKSNELEAIRKEGQKNSKDLIAEKQKELEEVNAEIASYVDYIKQSQALAEETKKNAPAQVSFETTKTYSDLKKELGALNEGDLLEVDEEKKKQIAELDVKISEAEEGLNGMNEKLSQIEFAEKQKGRVKELEAELQKLAATYEETERELYLCELFTKTKVSLLDEKINQRFRNVRFKLFDEQINGGIKDNCEVLIPCGEKLVPFAYANNASRINAGLEIIGTLSNAWERSIPVFVDNAESVSHLDESEKMQVIRLVVSEKDKELRLEKEA